jgi:hypothetical protein
MLLVLVIQPLIKLLMVSLMMFLAINNKAAYRVACISNGTQINGTAVGFTKHNIRFTCALLLMARQRVIIVAIQSPVQAMSTAMVWMI